VILKNLMAVALGCSLVSFCHGSLAMGMLGLRSVQSSEELDEFIFGETNEFVGFFHEGIAASDLASDTC
jgi:hypothetical protein